MRRQTGPAVGFALLAGAEIAWVPAMAQYHLAVVEWLSLATALAGYGLAAVALLRGRPDPRSAVSTGVWLAAAGGLYSVLAALWGMNSAPSFAGAVHVAGKALLAIGVTAWMRGGGTLWGRVGAAVTGAGNALWLRGDIVEGASVWMPGNLLGLVAAVVLLGTVRAPGGTRKAPTAATKDTPVEPGPAERAS